MRTLAILGAVLAALVLCSCGKSKKSDELNDVEKYQRRAKTTEATTNLKKLADGAKVSYEMGGQVSRTGEVMPRRFPSAGPTPAKVPCGKPVRTDPKAWQTPGWKQLGFAVMDPQYYQYQVISSGTGKSAGFTARAIGDLDCDGKHSTFELVGKPDAQGRVKIEFRRIRITNPLE